MRWMKAGVFCVSLFGWMDGRIDGYLNAQMDIFFMLYNVVTNSNFKSRIWYN